MTTPDEPSSEDPGFTEAEERELASFVRCGFSRAEAEAMILARPSFMDPETGEMIRYRDDDD